MTRIALAQIRPKKGDYPENLRRLGSVLVRIAALDPVPELVVTPETFTSGYFVEGGVRDVAVSAGTLYADLAAQHDASGCPPLDVAVGFYEEWRNRFYNSALYATLGGPAAGVRHVHRKVFLPTYGVFDEERFVERGHDVQAFDTGWGGRAAFAICEDAWHSIVPTLTALDGAQLLIVPSASPARGPSPSRDCDDRPARPINVERWERIIRDVAEEHGIYVALVQLIGFEGGKAFAGGSALASPHGEIVAEAPLFEETLLVANLRERDVTRARADQPLLADLESAWPSLLRRAQELARPGMPGDGRAERGGPDYDLGESRAAAGEVEAHTARVVTATLPSDPLAMDCELVHRWLVEFLRDEVVARRGFAKGLVGLSGGVDSSLTAYLAVEALGRENVLGVRLPYRTSSTESAEHAALVAESLGIDCLTVDISEAVDAYLVGEPDADPTRRGNVMARQRMIVLFDLSAKLGALPLGTGNKSERLLGYFTWHADDSPPVNPLGDLFKVQVWALARHVGVPREIVDKPATADLIIGQTDERDLGISYPKADRILAWLLRGLTPAEVAARGFQPDEVGVVRQRLESTHWKRRLPTVAMISQTAIGEYYLRPVDY
jgi:NAD+ synthetase